MACCLGGSRSIQLSYGDNVAWLTNISEPENGCRRCGGGRYVELSGTADVGQALSKRVRRAPLWNVGPRLEGPIRPTEEARWLQ